MIISSFLFGIIPAQNSFKLTKKQWLQDLRYASKILVDKHPDVHYRKSEVDFNRSVNRAEQKIIQSQRDEECLVAIRQVVASIYDGHTSLRTNNMPGYRDIFPVRMYPFSDGIFITGIAEKHAKYIGSKVLKIGKFPAKEAFDRAGTLAFADNEFSRINQAPVIVISSRFAYGLGITDRIDRLWLTVETATGSHDQILLSAVTPSGTNNMLRGMDIGPARVPFASTFTAAGKRPLS